MSGFDFLRNLPFADPAKTAEQLIAKNFYVPALIQLRMFVELLGKELVERHRLPALGKLQDLEQLLVDRGILNPEFGRHFKSLRLDGNDAAHEGKGDEQLARRNLEKARRLAEWFYNQYEEPERNRRRAQTEAQARQRQEQEQFEAARRAQQERTEWAQRQRAEAAASRAESERIAAERRRPDEAARAQQEQIRRSAIAWMLAGALVFGAGLWWLIGRQPEQVTNAPQQSVVISNELARRRFAWTCFQGECWNAYLISTTKTNDGTILARFRFDFDTQNSDPSAVASNISRPFEHHISTSTIYCQISGYVERDPNEPPVSGGGHRLPEPNPQPSHASVFDDGLWNAVCKGQFD